MSATQVTSAATSLSAVEVALTYGGDYQLTATGDLAVVQDSPYDPAATIQRITFLILTNPAMPNVTNTALGEPDDMFNPQLGSGARAYVGRNYQLSNIDAMERNILNALAQDTFVQQTPRPTVTFAEGDGNETPLSTVLVTVSFVAITGQIVTIPNVPLGGGAS